MHNELQKLTNEELIDMINEKTDYLSMIIHQLRTPLTAEKWFLEILATGHINNANQEEKIMLLEKAQCNIENSLKLLRELSHANHTHNWQLSFSPQKYSIVDIVEHNVQIFAGEAMAKHISIVIHASKELSYLSMVDPDKIGIVIANILENSLKYSAPGTTVDIHLDHIADNILVSITDNGIGIPYDDQKYICTKLYRGSNTLGIPGSGLGMYIAKQIIDYHHGSLWFESIPDIGTTFFIKLPTC
jgi:signal transduction histidine kinase